MVICLAFALTIIFALVGALKSKDNYGLFMRRLLKDLDDSKATVQFLLSSFGGVECDIENLKKRGICGPEIESLEKTIDNVNQHFRKD